MSLKDIIEKYKRRNEVYEQLSAQQKAMQKIENKQLTADERELQRYLKEKRDQIVHAKLEIERKKRENEWWHKDIITQKNIFANSKSNLLKQDNLFT